MKKYWEKIFRIFFKRGYKVPKRRSKEKPISRHTTVKVKKLPKGKRKF